MANPKKRVRENVPGDFFVDSTCIDCDACRQIAPTVFGEAAQTSYVKAQPAPGERRQAIRALLSCPTGSIGCLGDDDVKALMRRLWVSVASDGSALNLQAAGFPHPRSLGTNPRVLGKSVREAKPDAAVASRDDRDLAAKIEPVGCHAVFPGFFYWLLCQISTSPKPAMAAP